MAIRHYSDYPFFLYQSWCSLLLSRPFSSWRSLLHLHTSNNNRTPTVGEDSSLCFEWWYSCQNRPPNCWKLRANARLVKVWAFKDKSSHSWAIRSYEVFFESKAWFPRWKLTPLFCDHSNRSKGTVGHSCELLDRKQMFCPNSNDRPGVISFFFDFQKQQIPMYERTRPFRLYLFCASAVRNDTTSAVQVENVAHDVFMTGWPVKG